LSDTVTEIRQFETVERIDSLTTEQENMLPAFRDKWIGIGLSTEAGDENKAEESVDRAYVVAEQVPPVIKIWLDSPMQGAVLAAMLLPLDVTADVIKQKLGGASIKGMSIEDIRDKIGATDPKPEQIRDQLSKCSYGCHDASWLSFYDTFAHFGLECCEKLRPLMDLADDSGWWWPFEGLAIITRKPLKVDLDDNRRLHCPDGPAVHYKDDFSVYAWHGMRVESHLIEEPIKLEMIDKEQNAEIRRMMLERYGFDKYIQDCGAEIIHEDKSPADGTPRKLLKKTIEGDEDLLMVQLTNSTAEPDGTFKLYHLRVRPDVTTCQEAVASTFRMTAKEYRPAIET